MALNPSNRLDEGLKGFPTLGDPPFPLECMDLAIAELRAAGFPRGSETITMLEREVYKEDSEPARMANAGIHVPGMAKPDDIEWAMLYDVDAKLYGWKFRRAWYYWVAYTKDSTYYIPEDDAEKLNQGFRREARVEGFAGGQDVRGPVAGYHIDTPRGLAALMELLKTRYEAIREEQLRIARGGAAVQEELKIAKDHLAAEHAYTKDLLYELSVFRECLVIALDALSQSLDAPAVTEQINSKLDEVAKCVKGKTFAEQFVEKPRTDKHSDN